MVLRLAALAIAAFAAASAHGAGTAYPARPLRMIVPFAPGGGLDISTRLIGQKLTEAWGQNIVVDTRPGAATIVGTEVAARAVPDGYTFLMITTTFAINPGLHRKLPYDPVRDFAPVTQLNSQPNIVVVSPALPARTVNDLIALARSKPGELAFATPGAGSAPHLSAEMFQRAAGIAMIHVPYKGIPPAVTDVIGGRVAMLFTTTISAAPHVNAGKLRAVAITSAKRLAAMPDVPTVGETLPGYRAEAFQGMVAPAGVPAEILARVAAEVGRIVRLPEIAKRFEADGATAVGSTPAEFSAFLREEMKKWGAAIREAGIKPGQ
ncbi:MAG: tripartite tricarboxylate transporter substrate binding protein [Burkholderiales bacterium]|nr:tripartite tricarboxylate transporter substrate binding protein [Burkholderiales bacterium]